jgi:hypothetical protein
MFLAITLVLAVSAGIAAPASAQKVTEIKVEKVKPKKQKHSTLRFLKDNRDFIRERLDLLRQSTTERGSSADELDPRFLAYQKMLQDILGAEDAVAAAQEERNRMALLESVSELAALEAQLDLIDSLLAGQRERLSIIQADFTGMQRTELIVLLSGYPQKVSLTDVTIKIEDGTVVQVPLTPEQQQSLATGGIAQIYHGFVEPREQIIEIVLQGDAWPGGDVGYVDLNPEWDRLTFLRLDLSGVNASGSLSMRATTWLHETEVASSTR